MKKEIKLKRLENKICKLQIERQTLQTEIRLDKEADHVIDTSEEYMEAAQPVAPAVYERGGEAVSPPGPTPSFKQYMDDSQSVYPAMEEQGGTDDGGSDFVDHEVTRGV